jgi:serine protease Do
VTEAASFGSLDTIRVFNDRSTPTQAASATAAFAVRRPVIPDEETRTSRECSIFDKPLTARLAANRLGMSWSQEDEDVRKALIAVLTLCLVQVARVASAQPALDQQEEVAFKQAAAQAEPSVVQIQTIGGLDLVGDMLTVSGPTTGVVVSADGLIITSSFNFLSRPSSIIVLMADGKKYPAEIVASDKARKLALLKIEAGGLTPIAAAPKGEVQVGQWALALGRTYDTSFPSVAVGVVSALDRIYGKAIQTDAKVSPVNYGGPLIDLEGRAIGVLVPMSPQEDDESAGVEWYDGGIAFAVPMEDVYAALPRLRKGETLMPGLMGVSFSDSSPLAGAAKIDRVRPESPAAKAGLKVGDVIVEIDGRPIERIPAMKHYLGGKYAGDEVAVTVRRANESLTSKVKLVDVLLPYESGYLGILPQRRSRTEAAADAVTIREVLPDSPAAAAGLLKGDQITAINSEPVKTAAELLDKVSRIKPGTKGTVAYRRGGSGSQVEATFTGIPNSPVKELPATTIPPRPEEMKLEGLKTGRFEAQIPGEDRNFWMYVPEDYNPDHQYGLVVWIHPPGDTYESDLLKAWKSHCDQRGLILVGPRAAQLARWTPDEADYIKGIVEWVREKYDIASDRIAIHGHIDGGLAWQIAFRQRDAFRGLAISGTPLRTAPPDNDPQHRQQVLIINLGDEKRRKAIDATAKGLQELKFPTVELKGKESMDYPTDQVESIVLWLDSLDRI